MQMNFFEFYDIPVSFLGSEEEIKQKFYANSKKFHPDFFANESEEKQSEMLDKATFNTNTFKTLSNPEKRIEYVLSIFGLLEDGDKHVLPQEFLMEMMEINETIAELEPEDTERIEKLFSDVAILEHQLNDELYASLVDFDAQKESKREEVLLQVKDLYFRKKYLLRIKDSLNKFAHSK